MNGRALATGALIVSLASAAGVSLETSAAEIDARPLAAGDTTFVPAGLVVGETWTEAGSPYVVQGDIDVSLLRIEEGVTVLMDDTGNYSISVLSTISVNGTEAKPVTFTAKNPSVRWAGLRFIDAQLGSNLTYCVIERSQSAGLSLTNTIPILQNCTVRNNTQRGVLANIGSGDLILEGCTIESNTSTSVGGGMHVTMGTGALTLIGCSVLNNTANVSTAGGTYWGGGIYVVGNFDLRNTEFTGNRCNANAGFNSTRYSYGGGLYLQGGTGTLSNCNVSSNLLATACSGSFCSARAWGAGIYIDGSSVTMTNCVVACNTMSAASQEIGGGIVVGSGTLDLVNCTIANNEREGLYRNGGTVTVKNSILYFNSGNETAGAVTVTYSDIDDGGLPGEGNLSLHPVFANSAGCNADDLQIVLGSPCVDTGDTTGTYDDACFPPSLGGVRNDMGAHGGPGACGWITNFPPAAPAGLTATPSATEIVLGWDANPEADLADYLVYRGTSPGASTLIDSVTVGTTTYTDTNATTGIQHYYRLKARDTIAQESFFSSEVCATVDDMTIPSAPATLSFVAGDSQVQLSWLPNPECDVVEFELYRGDTPNPTTVLASTPGDVTSYLDATAVNGNTYYYRHVAVDNFGNVGASSADVMVVVDPMADLQLAKVVDNPNPNAGEQVTFTVTVSNAGPDATTGVEVMDAEPAGLTFDLVTPSQGSYDAQIGVWTVGDVPVDSAAALTILATVDADSATNVSSIMASSLGDPNSTNNTASATVRPARIDLALSKSASDLAPSVGSEFVFQLDLTNLGPDDATSVEVTDLLPAGMSFVRVQSVSQGAYTAGTGIWNVGSVSNGSSAELQIAAVMDVPDPVTNVASITGAEQEDPVAENDSASVTVDAREADLALAKGVDFTNPDVGDQVTYTVTLTNDGPDDARDITVVDTPVSGLVFDSVSVNLGAYTNGVWSVDSLLNGAAATMTIVATVQRPGVLTNRAQVTSADPSDPDSSDDVATVDVIPLQADLVLTQIADATVVADGDTVSLVVTIMNDGPNDANDVEVTDLVPPGLSFDTIGASVGKWNPTTGVWDVGTLTQGSSATLTIDAIVGTMAAVTNVSEITASDLPDPDPNNDVASVTLSSNPADLGLSMTVDNDMPGVGETVTFLLTLGNGGPSPATDIEIRDAEPDGLSFGNVTYSTGNYDAIAGVWSVPSLADSATATLTIEATVDRAGSIRNTATIQSRGQADENAANDRAHVDLLGEEADLAVTKSVDDPSPAIVGQQVTFTVSVTNNGPNDAGGVEVTDLLPAGLTYVTHSPSQGGYSEVSGVWDVGTLAATATAVLTVDATADSLGVSTNLSEITDSSRPDPFVFNNIASAVVSVGRADLSVATSADETFPNFGSQIVLTVELSNDGPDDAFGIEVLTVEPSGLAVDEVTPSDGSYDSAEGAWTVDQLASGGSATLQIRATVTETGLMTARASVSSGVVDPNTFNDEADLTITGNAAPVVIPQAQTATLGIDIEVSALITDDQAVQDATLWHRQGGDLVFSAIAMSSPQPGSWVATIPGASVTERGIDYYVTAKDTRDFEGQSSNLSILVSLPQFVKSSPQPGGTEQTAYRLISVPLNLVNKNPDAVIADDLGPYSPSAWRLFSLGSDQLYHEHQEPGASDMTPGTGFLLAVKEGGRFIDLGEGTTLPTDQTFIFNLHRGWNFLGAPFTFSIPWDNVTMESGQAKDFRSYAGAWSNFSGSLIPFDAYAVWANDADRLFLNPDLSVSRAANEATTADSPVWSIQITAAVQDARDSDNEATIVESASEQWDAWDRPEAPPVGEHVMVAFTHPEWNAPTSFFSADARPVPSDGVVWEFEVRTNVEDLVTLSFAPEGEFPDDYERWIASGFLNVSQDVAETPEFTYVAVKDLPHRIRLVVGRRSFVENKLNDLGLQAMRLELAQNFPNPFGPLTTIRFGLPNDSRVSFSIYNVLGQRVAAVLENELKPAGYHVVIWDGRNQNRRRVASGVYFYTLEVEDRVLTKKLVVTR